MTQQPDYSLNFKSMRRLVRDLRTCEYTPEERRDFIKGYNKKEFIREISNPLFDSPALAVPLLLGGSAGAIIAQSLPRFLAKGMALTGGLAGVISICLLAYYINNQRIKRDKIHATAENVRHRRDTGEDKLGLENMTLDNL